MTPILSPIPFAWWGLDIIGPFPPSTKGLIHLCHGWLYTKWVEVQVVAKITQDTVVNLVYLSIVFCFGVPLHIAIDNGSQFTGGKSSRMWKDLGIGLHFSSMYQLQGNDQVEIITSQSSTNRRKRWNWPRSRGLISCVKFCELIIPWRRHPQVAHLFHDIRCRSSCPDRDEHSNP